jgi:hypothetical protein
MNSHAFATEIVVPTVKEALADRANKRRAYVASIITYSLVDYIAAETGSNNSAVCNKLRKVCKPAFEVVQGVCNGTKHKVSTGSYRFSPGDEQSVPIFAFSTPGVGFGHGRLSVSGLSVEYGEAELFLDTCVQIVLRAFCDLYPKELGKLDLSFLDKMVFDSKGT